MNPDINLVKLKPEPDRNELAAIMMLMQTLWQQSLTGSPRKADVAWRLSGRMWLSGRNLDL